MNQKKNNFKGAIPALIAASLALPSATALAQTARVQLNGQPLTTQVSPIQRNNRTLLPMRDIFEALGASVQWDNATQSINATQGTNQIWLQIGNRAARVNEQPVQLDQAAFLYRGVTMVPLRFVAEALGAQVSWNDALKLVSITRDAQSEPLPPDTVTPPQTAVVSGIVTRDLSSDQFELRGDNGQTYQIRRRAGGALPRIGERVEARGTFDGNIFVADSVGLATTPIPQPDPGPVATAVDFEATVTAITSANQITVRRDNGVIYTVNSESAVPNRIRLNDRVRITGDTAGNNEVDVDRVTIVRSDGAGTGGSRGAVDFEAVITDIQSNTQLVVRRDNGATYTVTSQNTLPRSLQVGDRVQISGELTGRGQVSVVRVPRNLGTGGNNTDNTNPPPANGTIVRMRGTVVSSQGRLLQVRGEDGRMYTVRTNNASIFADGEAVRINGAYDNGIINATSIIRGR